MKLGVPTICSHIFHQGQWWSYEPFVLEMNEWAQIFEKLILAAPLESGPPPPFWAPYRDSSKIEVIPFRHDRGQGLAQERFLLLELPRALGALFKLFRASDGLHLRAPGSISLLASLLAPLFKRRLCSKYAGQWGSYPGEGFSYRLQRAILRSRWFHGPVTVYGEWPNQPPHIHSFFTSVMNDSQMEMARQAAQNLSFHTPPRILFVGRLTASKNVDILIQALQLLAAEDVDFRAEIIGDGPDRQRLAALCSASALPEKVHFRGGLPFDQVLACYQEADILVLASQTEGWPKAVAEGMAFGLACIGTRRGLVPQMLSGGRGIVVEPGDVPELSAALRQILTQPADCLEMRRKAALWAQQFTLEKLRAANASLLSASWNVELLYADPKTNWHPAFN
jgi:glycosyltransferase involved in cell wall biosynthesis